MVWPILISVAVTPRISAAIEAVDSSNETAASTPNAERIGFPFPFFLPRLSRGRGNASREQGCVGWAKERKRRAHHPRRARDGGHASLCPPYNALPRCLTG